jgi:DNA-binding response OmpR family regulator
MAAAFASEDPLETSELDIKSILLLDDDPDLADTLKLLLESRNFVVTTVSNGVEGLREVMSLDFDVIICDMMMPAMPGDMFYLAVQRTKPHLCSRFLFVTGHGDNPKVNDFLKKTDGLVLFKPVLTEDLVRMISLVLKRSEAEEQAERVEKASRSS